MIEWLLAEHVLVSVENPAGSQLWNIPEFVAWRVAQRFDPVTVDYCQVGMPWRKRTAFWFAGIHGAHTLCRLCKGHKGVCSRTNELHVILRGSDKGVCKTKLAEKYPRQLCHRIAFLILQAYRLRRVNPTRYFARDCPLVC